MEYVSTKVYVYVWFLSMFSLNLTAYWIKLQFKSFKVKIYEKVVSLNIKDKM